MLTRDLRVCCKIKFIGIIKLWKYNTILLNWQKKRYERTEPVLLDVSESPERLDDLIKSHNVVISLLPWTLHPVVAKKCIANKTGTYLIHLDYITLNLHIIITNIFLFLKIWSLHPIVPQLCKIYTKMPWKQELLLWMK